jgi:inner membrane protein
MDSITHLALGACMGESFAGNKLGKKAMLWGALAQSIPDIDFLAAFWMDTTSNLLAHRGFTHSLLFCALITPVLALLAERWHRPHNISFLRWVAFFGGVIFAHVILDAFNNYGVGWFEPFDQKRVTFNVVYIADPLFSLWPGLACIALLVTKAKKPERTLYWILGLGIAGIYLSYCLFNKHMITQDVKASLEKQEITYTRFFTQPAPFQNWLWYVVAGDDKGYHIGYRSIFDKSDHMDLTYFPRNDEFLTPALDHESLHKLIRFSQQYYTIEKWDSTLVFNDLRFGQIMGWQDPKGKFVFHYFLEEPSANLLVVQRGRFKGWNAQTFRSLWQRIKGNQ